MKQENERIKELEEKIRLLEESNKLLSYQKLVLKHVILEKKKEKNDLMTTTEKQI